jgi:hypothetical protein
MILNRIPQLLDINTKAQRIATEQLDRERAEEAARVTDREKLAVLIRDREASRLEAEHIRTAVAKTSHALKVAQAAKADADARVAAGTNRLAARIMAAVKEGRTPNTAEDDEAMAAQQAAIEAQKEADAAEAEIRKLTAAGGVIGNAGSEPERRFRELSARVADLATKILYADAEAVLERAIDEQNRIWGLFDLIGGFDYTAFKDRATPMFLERQKFVSRRHAAIQADARMQADMTWDRYLRAKFDAGAARWQDYHRRLCDDASATLDPA